MKPETLKTTKDTASTDNPAEIKPSFRQIITGQGITDEMTEQEAVDYFKWACSGSIVLGARYSPREGWQPELDCKGGH